MVAVGQAVAEVQGAVALQGIKEPVAVGLAMTREQVVGVGWGVKVNSGCGASGEWGQWLWGGPCHDGCGRGAWQGGGGCGESKEKGQQLWAPRAGQGRGRLC